MPQLSANDLAFFLGALLLQEHEGKALITLDSDLRVNLSVHPIQGPNGERQVRCVATNEALPAADSPMPAPIPLRQRRTTPIFLPDGSAV